MTGKEKELEKALDRLQKAIPVILKVIEEGKVGIVTVSSGASEEDVKITFKIPEELIIPTEGVKEISFRPYFNQFKVQFCK